MSLRSLVAAVLLCVHAAVSSAADSALRWNEQSTGTFTKSVHDGVYRLMAKSVSMEPVVTLLGEFSAKPQKLYQIEVTLRAQRLPVGTAGTVLLRWQMPDGQDASIEEKALGYQDSTLQAALPDQWTGQAITIALTGPAPRVAILCGQLELRLAQVQAAQTVEITAVRIREGGQSWVGENPQNEDSAKFVIKNPAPGFAFACNLTPNPSFEECADGETPAGWRYEGPGAPHLGNAPYAGQRCLLLQSDNTGGRWIADPVALQPNLPVWLCYWLRFSKYARPSGHPHPLTFEFLRRGPSGDFVPVHGSVPLRFEFPSGKYFALFGKWFPAIVGPVLPPAGATHVRPVARYQDEHKSWTARPFIANWGDIAIDQVLLWQAPAAEPTTDGQVSPYAPLLASAVQTLPPFIPVGAQRSSSVAVFPVRQDGANLFFHENAAAPVTIKSKIGNLLPIARELRIDGRILDWNGEALSNFQLTQKLPPFAAAECVLPVKNCERYGAYMIELQVFDGKQACAEATVRFALLRPAHIDDAVRHNERYPFDMHPTGINADLEGKRDPAEIDFQMRLLRAMGVRGIRLQSRFHGMNFSDAQKAADGARAKVAHWRKNVWPVMEKYGIEGWVSLMEQGSNNTRGPITEQDFRSWRAYNRAQAEAFGSDVRFILFGNEGLGGYTTDDPDKNLLPVSSFSGTTRDWMKAYQSAREAVKGVLPQMPFGPAHASDTNALVAKRFFSLLGDQAQLDCWGFNAYGNSAEMGANILQVLTQNHAENIFAVIPEVGLDVPAAGADRVAGERRQAITLVQTYIGVLAKTPWVRRIAWFILQGSGQEGHYLFDGNWTPRPAAAAYPVLAERLGAGRIEQRINLAGGGEFFVWRTTGGAAVGIGWSATGQSITLETGRDEVWLDDLFGNRQSLKTINGIVNVKLTEVPQYILGATQLNQSRRIEIKANNATTAAGGDAVIAVEIRNNGKTAETLDMDVLPHPLIQVEPVKAQTVIGPYASVKLNFRAQFIHRNDRVRKLVAFQATNANGMTFRVNLADTFAACVKAPAGFQLDGTWTGWQRAEELHADQRTQVESPKGIVWGGPDDVSAGIRTMWDENYFYLGLTVRDNVFFAQQPVGRMFLNDAIEIGFDLEHRLCGDSTLWQLVMGRSDKGNAIFRHQPGIGAPLALTERMLFITPVDARGKVDYQVAIPWGELGGFVPAAGRQIGFGVIVDDSDGKPNDRRFISWFGSGISSKRPQDLGDLIFVD